MPSLPLTSGPVAEVLEAGEREEGKETGGSASEQDYLEFIAEEGVCVFCQQSRIPALYQHSPT